MLTIELDNGLGSISWVGSIFSSKSSAFWKALSQMTGGASVVSLSHWHLERTHLVYVLILCLCVWTITMYTEIKNSYKQSNNNNDDVNDYDDGGLRQGSWSHETVAPHADTPSPGPLQSEVPSPPCQGGGKSVLGALFTSLLLNSNLIDNTRLRKQVSKSPAISISAFEDTEF